MNYLRAALEIKKQAEFDPDDKCLKMTPAQLKEEHWFQDDQFDFIRRNLKDFDPDYADTQKVEMFKLQADCALSLAKALELDIFIESRDTKGTIKLYGDILCLEQNNERWLFKIFLGLLTYADGIWYEIVDRYDTKVICMNMYYDLAEG